MNVLGGIIMSDLFDLSGKTVAAVGGNSVLGSSMVKGLGNQGAKIAVVGRNMETAEAVVQEIEQDDGTAKAFQADVISRESLENAANKIEAWSGGWDVLLNAPGTNSPTPFFEIEEEEWDTILDVNLKGIKMTCQIFAKKMNDQKRKVSIINITSVSSTLALSRIFTY